MKKFLSFAVACISVAMISSPAWSRPKGSPNQICAALWKACEASGKKGKEANECVNTLKEGGTVAGITVNDSDVKKCQAELKRTSIK